MSTSFTQRGVEQSGTPSRDALDQQQAVLLEILRRAAGAAVSYAQLHDAGIEFPASVVSELELAGVGVERCRVQTRGGRQLVGVRLESPRECAELPDQAPVHVPREAPTGAARALRALGDDAAKRWLPAAALLAAGGDVAALVLVALSGGGRPVDVAVAHRQHRPVVSAAARSHAPAASKTGAADGLKARPVPRAASTPVSPALAVQLDAEGHEMLDAGRYGQAIELLEKTLPATGENLQDCLRPATGTCLTYAYALYDLGRALLLNGDPAAAVAVLQRRLQIENQRSTVKAQLELALARRT